MTKRDRWVVISLVVAGALAVGALFVVAAFQAAGKQQQRVDQAYCGALAAKGLTDPDRCG